MDTKQLFNTNKNVLIRHSFNKAYGLNNTSIINKVEPPVVQYILTTSSILDLSLNTFRFKKHLTKAAFKTNFCRGFVGNCDIQTVQIVLHYSSEVFNNKTRMIAGINSLFVSSVSGLKNVPPAATLPIPFNFQNKHSKQNKKNTFILRNQKKVITKSEKNHYLEPIAAAFGTSISPFMTPKAKYAKTQKRVATGLDYTALKKLTPALFTLMRAKMSFKRTIENKEIIVKNSHRFNTLYPLSSFLPSAFTPILSCKTQRANADQKWAKTCSFKENKNLTSRLLCADWVLSQLVDQYQLGKKNPRAIMNQLINDIRILIEKMGSECPITGARVTLTGRLGSRKKGMAQQISKCVGKIPLSTLRQKVDYSQGFLVTRLGLIGVKVWVCYK